MALVDDGPLRSLVRIPGDRRRVALVQRSVGEWRNCLQLRAGRKVEDLTTVEVPLGDRR